ncbi:MAG TPA: hypothetical protein VJ805_13805 [Nitrospiraceae bacterium]|nr:hypothetical protein [Nitrospiraceae bacterium]
MMLQPISDPVRDSQEAGLRRRLAWRRMVLETIGISLIVAGVMVDWPSAEDPSLPSTRPFFILVGLLIFAAGLALERRLRSS